MEQASKPTNPPQSLRERKKLRTRQALVDTALELFSQRGFAAVTLDEIVDAVEVSKRTFFRAFASKEDLALAPEKELWAAYQEVLVDAQLPADDLLTAFENALFTAVETMADGWEHRFLVSRALADRTPTLAAHSLRHCAEVSAAIVNTVGDRLGTPAADRARLRLLLDLFVAAWHRALENWSVPHATTQDREALATHMRAAFALIPGVAAMVRDHTC
ncbi:TetR family transcriptional regulator [Streptomyces nigrescens]|uniref:TetR family transcriptional regulator n=2 Tax=Streptomyces TaxID=1883 RepID=A0ABM7ZU20_STRNI|nr:TetR/AcrR family transcriptional regulator [Streptomyces nigrescens]MEE4417806.1 TetR/AcrR family transcriptional regulator [Streptomyces sp. DSM 41528]BDM69875.1 TetR family transcriptional regulator [Streptomyces nigrescens]